MHIPANEGIQSAERLIKEEDLRVDCKGAGQPNTLLHSAAQLVRVPFLPSREPHHLNDFGGAVELGGFVNALNLETVDHVVQDPLVGKVAEVLEDHAHLVAADVPQLLLVHREQVLAVYEDLAASRFDETAETADERRLAAAGEAHDDEGLSFPYVEGDIPDSQHAAGLGQDLLPGKGRVDGVRKVPGSVPKHLPEVSALECQAGVYSE